MKIHEIRAAVENSPEKHIVIDPSECHLPLPAWMNDRKGSFRIEKATEAEMAGYTSKRRPHPGFTYHWQEENTSK